MSNRETILRSAPPLLLGAGLVLWGWQNGFLAYAVLMGLLLELPHYINWRWPVTDKEFNNLTDLSGLVFFIVIIYIFTDKGAEGIYTILSIIPFVLFFLILVQLYSDKGGIKLSALFISLRKLDAGNSPELNRYIDVTSVFYGMYYLGQRGKHKNNLVFSIMLSFTGYNPVAGASRKTLPDFYLGINARSFLLYCLCRTVGDQKSSGIY